MSRDQGCWTAQRQVGPGERTWAVWHIRNLDIKGSLKKKGCQCRGRGRGRSRSVWVFATVGWSVEAVDRVGFGYLLKKMKVNFTADEAGEECRAQLKWNEEREEEREWEGESEREGERDLSAGKSSPSSSFCFWFWPQTKLAITLDDQRCWFWAARCTFSYFYGVPRNYR